MAPRNQLYSDSLLLRCYMFQLIYFKCASQCDALLCVFLVICFHCVPTLLVQLSKQNIHIEFITFSYFLLFVVRCFALYCTKSLSVHGLDRVLVVALRIWGVDNTPHFTASLFIVEVFSVLVFSVCSTFQCWRGVKNCHVHVLVTKHGLCDNLRWHMCVYVLKCTGISFTCYPRMLRLTRFVYIFFSPCDTR